MVSFAGAAMSGTGMALVDLPLGTSPRSSVWVDAAEGDSGRHGQRLRRRCPGSSRARWRNGWFGAALGNSGVGSILWMESWLCGGEPGSSQEPKRSQARRG